jgi:hypothetical protein
VPGGELEYWRVEKANSVIVLSLQVARSFCVAPNSRPGIGRATLDCPGGRLPTGKMPNDVLPFLLPPELGVVPEAIRRTEALNVDQWIVNSFFSNQGLWAVVAEIDETLPIPHHIVDTKHWPMQIESVRAARRRRHGTQSMLISLALGDDRRRQCRDSDVSKAHRNSLGRTPA